MLVTVQMDCLARLNHETDSTLFLLKNIGRDATFFSYEPQHLTMHDGELAARGCDLIFDDAQQQWRESSSYVLPLHRSDVILLRQDPPFDMAYLTATWLLEALQKNHPSIRIINDPVGVRNCPEKLAACFFPSLMPPTLVTHDVTLYEEFRAAHGKVVLKPLHDKGGAGIFIIAPDDANGVAAFDTLVQSYGTAVMVQRYETAIESSGDKRIIMIDGEAVGAFSRLPSAGDGRANLARGGTAIPYELTPDDEAIVKAVRSFVRQHGLFFVGLDVIGDYLTEINVTSPTGLVTLLQLSGINGAEIFWKKLA